MAGYLRKYQGTYRIKADYDLETNDYPRLEDGSLDPSFDDYYIYCANKVKIRHGTDSILSCYIPSKPRGLNILREILGEKEKDNDKLYSKLMATDILKSIDILDGEVYFTFRADKIDFIAKIVKAKTSGANISPLSKSNLPKAKYDIPDKDISKYRKIIKDMEMTAIKNLNVKFKTTIALKELGKNFNINADMKKECLDFKKWVHKKGLWEKYLEFMKGERGKIKK